MEYKCGDTIQCNTSYNTFLNKQFYGNCYRDMRLMNTILHPFYFIRLQCFLQFLSFHFTSVQTQHSYVSSKEEKKKEMKSYNHKTVNLSRTHSCSLSLLEVMWWDIEWLWMIFPHFHLTQKGKKKTYQITPSWT